MPPPLSRSTNRQGFNAWRTTYSINQDLQQYLPEALAAYNGRRHRGNGDAAGGLDLFAIELERWRADRVGRYCY